MRVLLDEQLRVIWPERSLDTMFTQFNSAAGQVRRMASCCERPLPQVSKFWSPWIAISVSAKSLPGSTRHRPSHCTSNAIEDLSSARAKPARHDFESECWPIVARRAVVRIN
jgi:hypothetical protein